MTIPSPAHPVLISGQFLRAVGWAPIAGVTEGIRRLHDWLHSERGRRDAVERVVAQGG